ncbi:H/ACA ribonucleoprotein complex non-core subunit NAF1 isoform X2 [Carica papaya]|nr:H/ACA ribonucleoprotein complex non-core subunit NAF1 isoform X2 [Carica papaya]
MEVVQEESTEKTSVKNQFPLVSEPTSNMAELVGCSSNSTGCVSTCLLKVNSEEEAHKQEGDFSCCIEEKMEKVKAVEEASGEETLIRDQLLLVAEPVDRPELVVGSSKQNEHLSSCLKIEDQECHQPEGTIVEEMGKVSLVGGSQNFPADGNCVPKIEPQNEADSESSSESESESSSSGSDSTDNSSDDEEEEEDAKKQQVEGKMYLEREGNVAGEIEEGEIRNVDGEAGNGTNDDSADDESEEDEIDDDDDDDDDNGDQMISASDIEFGDIGDDDVNEQITGPIKSKNELQELPPVPPVDVLLQPHHKTMPVGLVLSVLGAKVIVEGVEKHNPLNEGSILWITENRTPLGLVDEIFGPVKNPYYVVRYNSESEVPVEIHQGTLISFVPEFADHVLNDKNLYKKGYDASGENDEELSDEVEFSDDEKEADYKRMQKMTKRGTSDQRPGNRKNVGKKVKNRDGAWKNCRHSAEQTQKEAGQPLLPPQDHIQQHPSSATPSLDHGGNSSSLSISSMGQSILGGSGFVPSFPHMPQASGFVGHGVWPSGMLFQQPQNSIFPLPGVMPWLSQNQQQQNLYPMSMANTMGIPNPLCMPNPMGIPNPLCMPNPMPMPSLMPLQQQLDPNQNSLPNLAVPIGQPNPFPGPSPAIWSGFAGQNSFNQTSGTGEFSNRGRKPFHRGGRHFSGRRNRGRN